MQIVNRPFSIKLALNSNSPKIDQKLSPNSTIAVIWKIPLEIILENYSSRLGQPLFVKFLRGLLPLRIIFPPRNSRFVQVHALDRSVFRRSNPWNRFQVFPIAVTSRLRATLSLVRSLFSRLLHPYLYASTTATGQNLLRFVRFSERIARISNVFDEI